VRACQVEINASVEFRKTHPLVGDTCVEGVGVRESRTMLPGVGSGQGQGPTGTSREPGFCSPLPLASECPSGSLADEEKATSLLAGDGTTGDARDGQGPYRRAGAWHLGARGGYRAMASAG
jgi:hypothetical protein